MLGQNHYHSVFIAPSECSFSRSSLSLAGDFGRCLAGRLVVWLLTHASVLHAHVVHSSLIVVVAVVSMVHILVAFNLTIWYVLSVFAYHGLVPGMFSSKIVIAVVPAGVGSPYSFSMSKPTLSEMKGSVRFQKSCSSGQCMRALSPLYSPCIVVNSNFR